MRRTHLLAGGTLGAALVLATLALAQPRSRPAHPAPKPKPAASTGENPYEDKNAPAPASAPSASASSSSAAVAPMDGGAVPAPLGGDVADGGKLSPLNPAPNEFSEAGMSTIAIDYDRLLADVAALRARVAAVSDTLFHSRIAVAVETSGDHGRIASLNVSLDDGVVWTSPAAFRAEDSTIVYEHAVAPGHHAVTIDVERRDDRNDTFRSRQQSRFVVDVPPDQRLALDVRLWDDSNMGGDFPTDRSGQYELRVRARARAQPIPR
jgi:hypothetical protein